MLLLAENFTLKVLTRLAHKVLGILKLKYICQFLTICMSLVLNLFIMTVIITTRPFTLYIFSFIAGIHMKFTVCLRLILRIYFTYVLLTLIFVLGILHWSHACNAVGTGFPAPVPLRSLSFWPRIRGWRTKKLCITWPHEDRCCRMSNWRTPSTEYSRELVLYLSVPM